MLVAAPAHDAVLPVAAVTEVTDRGPDAALVGAALALCAVALSGAGVIARVRADMGLA